MPLWFYFYFSISLLLFLIMNYKLYFLTFIDWLHLEIYFPFIYFSLFFSVFGSLTFFSLLVSSLYCQILFLVVIFLSRFHPNSFCFYFGLYHLFHYLSVTLHFPLFMFLVITLLYFSCCCQSVLVILFFFSEKDCSVLDRRMLEFNLLTIALFD